MHRHSQVYIDFYELHRDSYESIVFFFEHHQSDIRQLPFEEQLELLAEYLNACFETGQYAKYLAHVDELLEDLIMNNVKLIHGRDEFTTSLFKKSASLFNLERYTESIFVIKQLCRMESANLAARTLYRRNLYQSMPGISQELRHWAAAGLLLAAFLTGADLFASQYVSADWGHMLQLARNIVFASSMLTLVSIEFKIRWLVHRVTKDSK